MKDICSAKVIVDTKQMKDAIMQRMIIMFLFFIYNSPAFNTPFELFDNSTSFKNPHFFYIVTSAFITYFTILSPIPHLRNFFFCAVVKAFIKNVCSQITTCTINQYASFRLGKICLPKFCFSPTTRTLF